MNANNKNTALIVEPRDDVNVVHLINDFQNKLGDDWIIVFYCGQNLKNKMIELLTTANVEVRELSVSNFNSLNEYSDFMKRKDVWQSLYGNFVLTFQFDTYIINESPHTIEHFINMNKSYIGGNMDCMHFCVNRILVNGYFGVHKPIPALLHNCEKISKLYCNETNKFIINH